LVPGGILNFNQAGAANPTWKKYPYLFPNGTGTGNRIYGDSTDDHYAVPPIGPFAYLRSSDYNGMYYDPLQTYGPWVSEGGYTFAGIPADNAPSDPVRGSGKLNLTQNRESDSDNWKFRFHNGMVIPAGTYYRDWSDNTWKAAATDRVVTDTRDVGVRYYPATYYLRTDEGSYQIGGTSGLCRSPVPAHYDIYKNNPGNFSAGEADALAPDGYCLQRYEIKAGNTFPSGRSYSDEMQNFANWFSYYRKRHLALRAGAGKAFDDIENVRVGGFTINTSSLQGMWDIQAQKTAFYSFLYNSVGAGGTPNREALNYAGQQFDTNAAVITHSCQQNFTLLFTDGFSNVSTSSGAEDADGDGYHNTIADIAKKYYNGPLRDDLEEGDVPVHSYCGKTGAPPWLDCNSDLHLVTYGITLGAQGHLFGVSHHNVEDAYLNPPTWENPTLTRNPVQVDDLYHAAVNSKGQMLNAKKAVELQDVLAAAIQNILESRVSTAAAIATNSTRLIDNTLIYQARFDSSDWSGEIIAYHINADGSVGDLEWDTDQTGKIPAHGSRNIFTWNGTPPGVEFIEDNWDGLASSQKSALQDGGTAEQGKDRLNWIRGDQSKEVGQSGGYLRTRTRILGDIVNSDPLVVGVPNFRYDKLPIGTDGRDSYAAFRTAIKDRAKMLYIGGNDGMLHAFNALTGEEKFAYLPKMVFDNLASLTSPDYTHKFFVDGSPYVGDAYIDGGWKTVLVGTLGAGGRGVFALDVTDPEDIQVLWEYTDVDLGFTIGKPAVARMQNGAWAAIFSNGYGSTNNKAFLYVVNLADGTLIKKIDTGVGTAGSPNGLATPALLADDYQTIEYAYAGDLQGNLWKFDLTDDADPDDWDIPFVTNPGSVRRPLFAARNAVGQVQPITAPLEIGRHPDGGFMIYFGTGKYFESGDNLVGANPPVQSFYGIRDNGSRIVETDRSMLVRQAILYEDVLHEDSDDLLRVVSQESVDYSNKSGWYLDLRPPLPAAAEGERVVSAPLLRHGHIIFTTLIPLTDPCTAGGTSWIMELDALGGSRTASSVFDINGDGKIDSEDQVTVIIDGEAVVVNGIKSTVGIVKTPAVIADGEIEYKYTGGSEGGIGVIREKGSESDLIGRRSWRQLQ
jgi:type IV pilus assembly protein PilY1